jgi:hypothetical protein
MLEKIEEDCAGGELYKALNNGNGYGSNLNITYNPNRGSFYDLGSNTISLQYIEESNGLFPKGGDGSLFHEMFHAYQNMKWNLTVSNYGNREVECKIAQVNYMLREPEGNDYAQWGINSEYLQEDGFARGAIDLSNLLDSKGQLVPTTGPIFFDIGVANLADRMGAQNSKYTFEQGTDNLKNIQTLFKNC